MHPTFQPGQPDDRWTVTYPRGLLVPDRDYEPFVPPPVDYPTVPVGSMPDEPVEEESVSEDQAGDDLEYFTVVLPIDSQNPTGPYLLRGEVAVVGGTYSLLLQYEKCGITGRPLDEIRALRADLSDQGLENDQ